MVEGEACFLLLVCIVKLILWLYRASSAGRCWGLSVSCF